VFVRIGIRRQEAKEVPLDIVTQIAASGLTIYDPLDERPELFIPSADLENLLNAKLDGLNLDYENRTRSKILKQAVCAALGYPVPKSFRRIQPRFPGQDFDTYVQKSNNLQIWNEEVHPSRRYVVIRVDAKNVLKRVRVIAGEDLAKYDATGKLTQKYQAKIRTPLSAPLLASTEDTANVKKVIEENRKSTWRGLLPIQSVHRKLLSLVGTTIVDRGKDQDRNRGAALHRSITKCLGLPRYKDSGQFPDIFEQLLEVKMQTASTVDLGLVCPDDTSHLSSDIQLRHCDVRYAVFYGSIEGGLVHLKSFVLTTGENFFTVFQRFEGRITNKKLQLPLPYDFFGQSERTDD
jgi:hypothetical protein